MRQTKQIKLIGVTGGMGSGQSTVADFFRKWGAKIISADKIAHQVVNKNAEVRNDIKRLFGKKVYHRNGRLNRKLLGSIVFADESKVEKLNQIVHPRMVEQIVNEIESARDTRKFPFVVIDAALIFEIQLENIFDEIVVVSSKIANRISRVKERDGLEEHEIQNRIRKQIPLEEKVKWADHVIHNNGNLEQLETRTRKIYDKILGQKKPPKKRR